MPQTEDREPEGIVPAAAADAMAADLGSQAPRAEPAEELARRLDELTSENRRLRTAHEEQRVAMVALEERLAGEWRMRKQAQADLAAARRELAIARSAPRRTVWRARQLVRRRAPGLTRWYRRVRRRLGAAV
jgi:chromosome segregation ATPase